MSILKNTGKITAVAIGCVIFLGGAAFAAHKSATTTTESGGMMGQEMMNHGMMGEGMLRMPQMDPARGRKLFASKGCVVCHSINGIGGHDAPALDASTMTHPMNPFEFAAKMWRGAEAMIYMQEEELGEQIEFTGDELADIIAFVHHPAEQKKFSEADIPPKILKLIEHDHDEDEDGNDMEESEGQTD
jgi:cytochrome c